MSAATEATVQLQPLSPEHLQAVKTLNSVLFPIKYHVRLTDQYYAAQQCTVHSAQCCCCQVGHSSAPPLTTTTHNNMQDRVYQDALACGPVSLVGK